MKKFCDNGVKKDQLIFLDQEKDNRSFEPL